MAEELMLNSLVNLEVVAIMYLYHLCIIGKSMVVDMENIIKIKRKELGLSQDELAKRCGVSRQTVNAIENNKYDPTLVLAFSLAKELDVTVDELFQPMKM